MLKVADVYVLRHLVVADGLSQREVARRFGISRNTVVRYLNGQVDPGVRVETKRAKPAQEAIKARVCEILDTSRVTQKQRLTAERVCELLREEAVECSVRTVSRIMRERRRKAAEVFVPLEYAAGDLAEVDFFEVVVVIGNERVKAFMFLMRLMHSGRDFAWLYRWQDQAAFLDGHVRAFAHFGRVPNRILYDNLKAAVRRIVGSDRELSVRFAALAAHYGFGCRFARPRSGHDKGGVEGRGKGVRLQHLTPLPVGQTLDEISTVLMARIDARLDRPRQRGGPSVAALWEEEKPSMLPLPERVHDAGILDDVDVDRQSQIRVRTARYSVPCTWAGLKVRVWVYADRVVAVHDGERVVHVRQPANGKSIWYPHYLPELARKPAAVEQVGDKLFEQLGAPFLRVWRMLVDQRGKQAAARSMKPLLQSVLKQGTEAVGSAIDRAFATRGDPLLLTLRPKEDRSPAATLPARFALVHVEANSPEAFRRLGGAS